MCWGGNALTAFHAPLSPAGLAAPTAPERMGLAATDISAEAAHDLWCANADVLFLDVRTAMEYNAGHIEGALNMPWPSEIMAFHAQLPNKMIIVYCASGGRSASASAYLTNAGHSDIFNMLGGYSAWLTMPDCPEENFTAARPASWRRYR